MKLILLVSIIFFASCGQNKNSKKDNDGTKISEEAKEENRKLERLKISNMLSSQFSASLTFDTVNYKMTYQYQDLIKKNNRVIIDRFQITDIEQKNDSVFVVSILKWNYRKVFIDFTCTKSQFEKIYPSTLSQRKITETSDKYLILKLNSVKKIKLKIDSYGEDNGENSPTTSIELFPSDAFLCKAEFLDIYLIPIE